MLENKKNKIQQRVDTGPESCIILEVKVFRSLQIILLVQKRASFCWTVLCLKCWIHLKKPEQIVSLLPKVWYEFKNLRAFLSLKNLYIKVVYETKKNKLFSCNSATGWKVSGKSSETRNFKEHTESRERRIKMSLKISSAQLLYL